MTMTPATPEVVKVSKPGPFKRLLNYVGCLVFIVSLVANMYVLIFLAGMQDDGADKDVLSKGSENQVVAVYEVSGVINDATAVKFAKFYKEVKDDKNVKAIVLRVDSPGGTVSASERIGDMVKRLKKDKKIVVSMGGVAASGGYLISSPADQIFAEPATITGSIGVITQLPNFEGTMDKIGVKMLVLKSTHAGGWKDMLSPFRPAEGYEKKRMIEILDAMQLSFEKYVKTGRGDRLKEVEQKIPEYKGEDKIVEPLNGKVYLADEAVKFGLVDKIGYQQAAIDEAAAIADLSDPRVVKYDYITAGGLLRSMIFGKSDLPEVVSDKIKGSASPQFMMIWQGQ